MRLLLDHKLAVFAFLAFRVGVSLALYWITGGEEVASDTRAHLLVIDNPFGVLNGLADPAVSSYPPLQFMITWPLYHALTAIVPQMVAFRLMMILIEGAAFLLLLSLLDKVTLSRPVKLLTIAFFAVGPHQFVASAVFVQEEVICQFFMLLAAWYMIDGRKGLALTALSAGVVFGKIFFIVPLFYLTFFHQFRIRDLLPWTLCIGVYLVNLVWALSNQGQLPIVGFNPYPNYASSFWVHFVVAYPEEMSLLKNISLLMAVCVQFVVLASFWKSSQALQRPIDAIVLLCLPIALFYLCFYQHMPEYLLMIWPLYLLLGVSVLELLAFTAVLNLAWAPNLFFGLMNVGIVNSTKSPTRNRILEPIVGDMPIDFQLLHSISIWGYSACYLLLMIWMWRRYRATTQ